MGFPLSNSVKLLLFASIVACLACRASAAEPAAKGVAAPDLDKVKKTVEKKLGRKEEEGHFVIALVTTTFVTNRPPNYLTRGPYARQQPAPVVIPQTTVRVENAEGRPAAADLIVQHITQSAEKSPERPPQHDWKLIGWFADADAAQKAAEKAQAKYAPRLPVGGKR